MTEPWNGHHEWQPQLVPGSGNVKILTALEPEEADELALLVTGKRYLEVGTAAGFSAATAALAGAASVMAVDYFQPDDSNRNGDGTALSECRQNLAACNALGLVELKCEEAGDALQSLHQDGRLFDIILVDARHDEESVSRDLAACKPLLSRGGRLLCHDYDEEHPGVVAAVSKSLSEWSTYRVMSLLICEPPEKPSEPMGDQ